SRLIRANVPSPAGAPDGAADAAPALDPALDWHAVMVPIRTAARAAMATRLERPERLGSVVMSALLFRQGAPWAPGAMKPVRRCGPIMGRNARSRMAVRR